MVEVGEVTTNDPTPAEIAEQCEKIRATWTEAETRKRSAWAASPRWSAPEVEVDEPGE